MERSKKSSESRTDTNKNLEQGNYGPGRKTPQYLASLAASVATFSSGTVIGWLSQISQQLLDGEMGFPISEDELGWIGSFMPFGAAILALLAGTICDILGRKNTMLLMIILITAGWSLILWANSVYMVYVGRFLTGMVAGGYCVTVPLYTNEIAQKEIRGTLGCFTQVMLSSGILFATIIGKYFTITNLTIIVAIIPIIFGIIFVFMPETPAYLLKKGKPERARKSLIWLLGPNIDTETEIKEILSGFIDNGQNTNMFRIFKESLKIRAVQKACIIGLGLMSFKILCGIDAITGYMSLIYEETGMDLNAQSGTIIFAAIQTTSALGQSFVVDKLGRRILLIVSDGAMTVCLILVGVTLTVKKHDLVSEDFVKYLNYVPLISLCIFIVAFSLGLGPVPFVMCTELFPQEIRSFASSVCNFVKWGLAIMTLKTFIIIQLAWGTETCFFIFAALSFAGTLFMYFLVPETKGKSFREIQELLAK